MNPTLITWLESIFNVAYLIVIWTFVFLMTQSMDTVDPKDKRAAEFVRLAFILLAAGDTGHVGFRVLANLLGGTHVEMDVFGTPMSLIGLGMLTTAYTVTLFYMLFVFIWQERNHQPINWFTISLLLVGVVRLVFMALPGNEWGNQVPPQPMSLYRNLPLMVQGIGVLIPILYSAYKSQDTIFKWIGWSIAVSFAFYIPVILFAQRFPLIGMLMIPKTCAYLAVAWIAYRGLWGHAKSEVEKIKLGPEGVSM